MPCITMNTTTRAVVNFAPLIGPLNVFLRGGRGMVMHGFHEHLACLQVKISHVDVVNLDEP